MKKLLLLVLLILIGCSSPEPEPEPINIDTLNYRNNTFYSLNSEKPYSGHVFEPFWNGQFSMEGKIKNGKKDGLWKYYHENGQLQEEETYKDDELDGPYKDYSPNGNGQIQSEGTYKDGELIDSKEY